MNIFRKAASKENKTLNVIFGSIAIGLLIVATYLTFSQHPLANSISSWQVTFLNDNTYFPALTIFLLALPPLLLLLVIKLLVLRTMKAK
jgi:hypothetical protein